MLKISKLLKIEKKNYKLYIYSYIILFFIMFFIGICTAKNSQNTITINKLSIQDIFFIFIINLILIICWLIASPIGLSLYFMCKFLIRFGQVGIESGINPLIYYSASISHGLGELFVVFIVFVFTIEQYLTWIKFFRTKNFNLIENFYKGFIKATLPIISLILLVSACFEVLISNRLINIIFN